MSFTRFTEDDLEHARDEVRAEIAKFEAEVMDRVPTCSDRGISEFDLQQAQIAADIVARHRLAALAEIKQRLRSGR